MAIQDPEPSLWSYSPITATICCVFGATTWLSPMQWLRFGCSLFRPRIEITLEETQSREFVKRRARAVEMYVLWWLIIEFVLVVLSCRGSLPTWIGWGLVIVAVTRIIEIVQVTGNAALFVPLSCGGGDRVANSTRILVLSGINFLELLVCFGVIYAVNYTYLHGAGRPVTAFYFSVMTQLTVGYGDVYAIGWFRIVPATQALAGVFFVILVFGRFMASLPEVRGVFGEQSSERQSQ